MYGMCPFISFHLYVELTNFTINQDFQNESILHKNKKENKITVHAKNEKCKLNLVERYFGQFPLEGYQIENLSK